MEEKQTALEVLPAGSGLVMVRPEDIIPDLHTVTARFRSIRLFQAFMQKELIDGVDVGPAFPGSDKRTLLKPGAEKVAKALNLRERYVIEERIEDWNDSAPFFRYLIKCQLLIPGTEIVVAESLGECNSRESKYRYRWVYESEVKDLGLKPENLKYKTFKGKEGKEYRKYRVDNEDIYSQINTILKISQKRSFVGATISAGRLGNLFDQDIDLSDDEREELNREVGATETGNGKPKEETPKEKKETKSKPKETNNPPADTKQPKEETPDLIPDGEPPAEDPYACVGCGAKLANKNKEYYDNHPQYKRLCYDCNMKRKNQ